MLAIMVTPAGLMRHEMRAMRGRAGVDRRPEATAASDGIGPPVSCMTGADGAAAR